MDVGYYFKMLQGALAKKIQLDRLLIMILIYYKTHHLPFLFKKIILNLKLISFDFKYKINLKLKKKKSVNFYFLYNKKCKTKQTKLN